MGMFVGIDPGLAGAIAVLTPTDESGTDLKCVGTFDLPTVKVPGSKAPPVLDLRITAAWLNNLREFGYASSVSLIALEAPLMIPTNGRIAIQRAGYHAGALEGILTTLNLTAGRYPYLVVHPQTWKKHILVGTKKDKQSAVMYVRRKYPEFGTEDLRPDVAEAVCMAEYAARIHATNAT